MAVFENVKTSIWSDDFAELDPLAKLLYLWSFTNPRCNAAGLYKVRPRAIMFETGITDLTAPLAELERGKYLFYADPWIFIRVRAKHYRTSGANVTKSMLSALEELPDGHPFIGMFLDEYSDNSRLFPNPTQTLSGVRLKRDSKAKSGRVLPEYGESPSANAFANTDVVVEETASREDRAAARAAEIRDELGEKATA